MPLQKQIVLRLGLLVFCSVQILADDLASEVGQ
jgi:hypothetical protein